MEKEIWCVYRKCDGITIAVCTSEEKANELVHDFVGKDICIIEKMWLNCLWEV